MAFAVGVVAAVAVSYAAGIVAWHVTPGWEEFEQTFKAAQVIVSIIPVLVVYPFVQKFFTQGIVMGSVKE